MERGMVRRIERGMVRRMEREIEDGEREVISERDEKREREI